MATYSIDQYRFVTLHRTEDAAAPPLILQPQTEIVQRPGVRGSGVLDFAEKGEPFQMRSAVDLRTDQIELAFTGYHGLTAKKRVRLVWADLDFESAFGVVYVVLRVEVTALRKISVKAGGLTPNATNWLEALWQLLPVPAEPEE